MFARISVDSNGALKTDSTIKNLVTGEEAAIPSKVRLDNDKTSTLGPHRVVAALRELNLEPRGDWITEVRRRKGYQDIPIQEIG